LRELLLKIPEVFSHTRVGNFQQKNYSAEDGRDGTVAWFRRNSGCSVEQKTLGIPFRTIPQKRKQLGIPCRGTKIEENNWNSVPNHSTEEKTTPNAVPWNKKTRLTLGLVAGGIQLTMGVFTHSISRTKTRSQFCLLEQVSFR
jgi:hypothetical protein